MTPHDPFLQRLRCFDKSSFEFQDQLCNIFYGEEYMRRAGDFQGEDLVWLVGYLDEVLWLVVSYSSAFA